MFEIKESFRFEAAHQLPKHDGKCNRLHGHSWVATVVLRSTTLHDDGPKTGMLLDFSDIRAAMKPLLDDYLDHYHLNDTLPYDGPTSELIAKWIFKQLRNSLAGLHAVSVSETCTSEATYYASR